MNKPLISKLALGLLSTALLAAHLPAAASSLLDGSAGSPIETGHVDREIAIDANTRFVNVWHDERIRFVNAQNGKRMDWHFDMVRRSTVIDFQPVAVALLDQQRVTVYVSPDPRRCGS